MLLRHAQCRTGTTVLVLCVLSAVLSCSGSPRSRSAETILSEQTFPLAAALPLLPDSRSTSVTMASAQNGDLFFDGFNATVVGQTASLQPEAGGIAWALYTWDCGGNPTISIKADHTPGADSEVWLAVSNYATASWDLHGPYVSGTEIDLVSGVYTSAGNAFYCVVIAYAAQGSTPGATVVNSATLSLDIGLPGGHSIGGSITDGAGQPLVGLDVELRQGPTLLDTVSTDALGAYSFANLSDGAYDIAPVVDAGTDVDPQDVESVSLAGADQSGIDFKVAPYESLGGTVLDESLQPVPDVQVSLVGGNGGSAQTDALGHYDFPGGPLYDLSEGDAYEITPSLPGYTFTPNLLNGFMPAGGISDADFSASNAPASYTVSGTITDGGGSPVQGVDVAMTGHGTASTDVNGFYSFTGVADGNYTVTPQVATTPASQDIIVSGADYPGVDFVTNGGGGGYVVSGYVTASGTGNPVQFVDIKLTPGNLQATTDSSGYYEFTGIADGNYKIEPQNILSSPPFRNISVSGADVSNVDFVNNGPPPPG